MFLQGSCETCFQAGFQVGNPLPAAEVMRWEMPLTAERAGVVTCGQGHQTLVIFADEAYAILYERALQRVALGAPRDAVLDAHTSWEMYLAEVPLRVRWASGGPSPEVLYQEMKAVLTTSDRCLAAAFTAVAIASKRAPPKLDEKMVTPRRMIGLDLGRRLDFLFPIPFPSYSLSPVPSYPLPVAVAENQREGAYR